MNINWKRVKNWLKFHLGMKCVARYGSYYIVTKRVVGLRQVRGNDDWWWYAYLGDTRFSHRWEKFLTEEKAMATLDRDNKSKAKLTL